MNIFIVLWLNYMYISISSNVLLQASALWLSGNELHKFKVLGFNSGLRSTHCECAVTLYVLFMRVMHMFAYIC